MFFWIWILVLSFLMMRLSCQCFNTKTKYMDLPFTISPSMKMLCPSCQYQYGIWIIRHGTRNPSLKMITKLNLLWKQIMINSNNTDHHWPFRYKSTVENQLTKTGNIEMQQLASRIRKEWGSNWGHNYDPMLFPIETTWKKRTQQSAAAFISGLFHKVSPYRMPSKRKEKEDLVLRFFDSCQKYTKMKNEVYHPVYENFKTSPDMKAVISHLENGLNISIQISDVITLYKGCAFDRAVWGIEDEFCTVFSLQPLLILHHFENLKAYFTKGYGNDLNWQMASPLLMEIHNEYKEHISSNSSSKASFRFSHAETILPLLCLLEILPKAEPILYPSSSTFSTCRIPFAANIAFLFFDRHGTDYFVLVVNEIIVEIPFCAHRRLCPLSFLDNFIQRYFDTWDFHQECQNE